MASVPVRHKHLRVNQAKLERVKSELGTATETKVLEPAAINAVGDLYMTFTRNSRDFRLIQNVAPLSLVVVQ